VDPRVEHLSEVEVVLFEEAARATGECNETMHVQIGAVKLQRGQVHVVWSSQEEFLVDNFLNRANADLNDLEFLSRLVCELEGW